MRVLILNVSIIFSFIGFSQSSLDTTKLELVKTISGSISPKSIIQANKNLFFAQNMMYRHTITVYNSQGELVKTISDQVAGQMLDSNLNGLYYGSPVEAAVTLDGAHVWVSNYQMYGKGFDKPGKDFCKMSDKYDKGYIYKVNTKTLEIEQAIKVGCIPKYVATTPDFKYVLVSNWCSGDLSIVSPKQGKEIKRIKLGKYPRGIYVSPNASQAWVTVMGEKKIAKVNLKDFSVEFWDNIGNGPRHLCLQKDTLFVSLNKEKKLAKIDANTGEVYLKKRVGRSPRSMDRSWDGKYLYVVNYHSNTMSKVRSSDLEVVQTVKTEKKPIGITFDPYTNNIWVACYSGHIQIFNERGAKPVLASKKPVVKKEVPVVAADSTGPKYHIIVGCFRIEDNVDHMLDACKDLGYSPKEVIKNGLKCISAMRFDDLLSARDQLPEFRKVFEGAWVLKQ